MKKILLISFLFVFCFSSTTFAAKYKVNTSGKVTNPTGQVQNSSVLQQNKQYNTYSTQSYTNNKTVLTGGIATIDIVMDYSGSMSNWINAAKLAMTTIVSQIPSSTKIGFRSFGQDSGNNPYTPIVEKAKKIVKGENGKYTAVISSKTGVNSYLGCTTGYCAATKQIVPVTTYNATTLLAGMNMTKIGGATPLTYALYQAVNSDFAGFATNYKKKIVLITDGDETCGGDPCAYVNDLISKRSDIVIDVVLVSSYNTKLQCLSNATGGKFYTANDPLNFSNAIVDSIKTTTQDSKSQTHTTQTENNNIQNYEYIDY